METMGQNGPENSFQCLQDHAQKVTDGSHAWESPRNANFYLLMRAAPEMFASAKTKTVPLPSERCRFRRSKDFLPIQMQDFPGRKRSLDL